MLQQVIPPVVKNTIEWIKNNKQVAILVGGILFLVILVVIALWPKGNNSGVELIDQPLFFYEKKTINIAQEIYKNFKSDKKYNIYKVKSENLNIKVEGIMSQLNINAPTKTGYDNVFYNWENKSGDKVLYNVKTQSVEMNLANHLNIFTDIVSPSDDQLKALLPSFVHRYINGAYEYTDVSVDKKPGEIKISGRRLLNGIPLQVAGLDKNYDSITLDDKYNLRDSKILLLNIEDKASDKLSIITPKQLANVVSKSSYPKEVNTNIPNGLDLKQNGEDFTEFSDNLEQGSVPKPTTLKAKNIELVYFFSNLDQQFLTPMYRLDVEGQIVYKGNTYNVEGSVNASAIDPNHVYIPSNITYAE